jgi:hypothetical protein
MVKSGKMDSIEGACFPASLTAVYSGCRIPFLRLRAFRQIEIARNDICGIIIIISS